MIQRIRICRKAFQKKYEMGTINVDGMGGLNAALRWIDEQTVEKLFNDEVIQRKRLIDILSQYSFIKIIGNVPGRDYVGIVSCLMDSISSDSAGPVFSERGISVRTGLQCAPLAHKFLNTYPAGTIRFSVNSMTGDQDFQELKEALDDIADEM